MIYSLLPILLSSLLAGNRIPNQHNDITHANVFTQEPVAQNTHIVILPRPGINPRFNSTEDNLCYRYAGLLVRNGIVAPGDPLLQDSQRLLAAAYSLGRIIIHHTATSHSPTELIRGALSSENSSDIGYHYMISPDGTITQGRSLLYMGANAGRIPDRDRDCANNQYYMDRDNDYRSIGIALIGNFQISPPPEEQIRALKQLIDHLKERFNILEVTGHRHLKSTLCPGDIFIRSHGNIMDPLTEEERLLRYRSRSPFNTRRLICHSCH